MYIFYITDDDTERRQGVELRAECSVRSVPTWHSYIILYRDKKSVREFARRQEGVAEHIIG